MFAHASEWLSGFPQVPALQQQKIPGAESQRCAEGRCCQITAQLAAVEKAGVKGGREVGHKMCLTPGLKVGDPGQVPCLGLPLPVYSTGVTTPESTVQGRV